MSLNLTAQTNGPIAFDLPSPPGVPMLAELLYGRPGFLLRRAHQISVSIFEETCSPLALTPGQFSVLAVLRADPTLDQSSVARAIGLDKVTVSLLLRGLEARGLVHRRPDLKNRRRRVLTLTPQGQDLMRRSRGPTDAAYERLMAPFDAQQRASLLQLLQQLVSTLEPCSRAPLLPLQR
ncbi:MarR family transcriptional regulator [Variovorax sp. EBFNA2]|uniref:MarR family winged helix-turn-helix transcriptional regulator n=1 Tax=Variovorax sp. EBFNA2 TaxID=3342097 RepID=UPI0029C00325|nr:MarR family transcriptional regulator [Variovorax boronicumulans]WPG41138.1 MarR family transcriptional regulator [Variovorax boronicumulans]